MEPENQNISLCHGAQMQISGGVWERGGKTGEEGEGNSTQNHNGCILRIRMFFFKNQIFFHEEKNLSTQLLCKTEIKKKYLT